MKQSTIIQAYKTIQELSQQKLPLAVGHKLWTVKRMLEPHWEFQREKEQEVFEKYKPVINEDGSLQFKDKEEGEAFGKEYLEMVNEVADLDVDLGEYKKVLLHFDDKIDMTVDEIAALSEFVDFVE